MRAFMAPPVDETGPRVRVLPPELADQIAAGEVVERAASVVKELVENALDAGARRVDVEVEGGGRRLIRVVDDGGGMTPQDARLALRRHATSKIARAEDLWGLGTFGFRGEALPSIAAVSRLTIATRPRGAEAGFRLVVEAGQETDARDVGIAEGTQVEVRDLFFNTPARQKFQKAESTEAANVSEAVLRLALAHPELHVKLRLNGRVALDLPAHRDLGERVRAGLARRGAGVLHEAAGDEGGNRVRAFLAAPEEAATTARSTFLFVGRRFVRDRSLLHALAMGYGELLEKGRYPLAALFVDVPGPDLDINVHPQKLEVRFARAQEVYAAVRHVVGAAVARAPWLQEPRGRPVRVYTLPPAPRAIDESPSSVGFPARSWSSQSPLPLRARDSQGAGAKVLDPAAGYESALAAPSESHAGVGTGDAPQSMAAAAGGFFASLRYVGQFHATYLVCEADDELVLIDQHAAHERIAFQRLRAAHVRQGIRRQRLLFPVPVELDEDAHAAATAGLSLLAGLGFDAEVFGATTLLLRAVPEILRDADPKPLLRDMLDQMAGEGRCEPAAERVDHVLATMACHSVVRAGDVLGREQAIGLLAGLDAVDLRSHCPHGRPVLLRMSLAEIERRFGRT